MEENRTKIIWSSDARTDLDRIWDYYEDVAGWNTAEKISREIILTCDVLIAHPFAGRARSEIRLGLRSLVSEPHMIFYRVGENDAPKIVRILDVRQDIDAAFIARGAERRT
jgi:plasmid stabilization system protein ParE